MPTPLCPLPLCGCTFMPSCFLWPYHYAFRHLVASYYALSFYVAKRLCPLWLRAHTTMPLSIIWPQDDLFHYKACLFLCGHTLSIIVFFRYITTASCPLLLYNQWWYIMPSPTVFHCVNITSCLLLLCGPFPPKSFVISQTQLLFNSFGRCLGIVRQPNSTQLFVTFEYELHVRAPRT